MPASTYTGSKGKVYGIGTVVSIGSATGATGTETFIPISEISDAKGSGRKLATVDASSFASMGVSRKLGAMLDYGVFSLTTITVFSDAGQLAVLAAQAARLAYDFEIQLPVNTEAGQTTTGTLISFSALVTQADFDISQTKVSEWTFELTVDGPVTITPGS
jgi:hypothetical protein